MNPDRSKRYKARLVIKGFEQTDYGGTYAPVAKLVSFRMMIPLAAYYEWELDQMTWFQYSLTHRLREIYFGNPREPTRILCQFRTRDGSSLRKHSGYRPEIWNN